MSKIFALFKTITENSFIKNVSKLFVFNRLASVFTTLIQIITARTLSPGEFGKISLVWNLCNFLTIFLLLGGNNSMYKLLPVSDEAGSARLKSTVFIGNVISTTFFTGIFIFAYSFISKDFNISLQVWNLSILLALMMNGFLLSESFLRGKEKFNLIGLYRFISAFVFFILILIAYYLLKIKTITAFFVCTFLGRSVFILFALFKSKVTVKHFNFKDLKTIYSYGSIVMVNMLFTAILFSNDFFILNYFWPGKDVGIYSVYQGTVKTIFSIVFWDVFAVVFLPTIAKMDKIEVFKRMCRYSVPVFAVTLLCCALFCSLMVFLSGKQYPFNILYILNVSAGIAFYGLFQIFNCLVSMKGSKGAIVSLLPFLIVIPISFVLQIFLTEHYGITGTMSAVTICYFLIFLVLILLISFIYKKQIFKNEGS